MAYVQEFFLKAVRVITIDMISELPCRSKEWFFLICNNFKNRRKTMRKEFLVLSLILSLSFSVKAENINCKLGQQSCGTNCCWSLDGTKLKITGGADGSIGVMDSYGVGEITERPWEGKTIHSVDVDGVSNIGASAFYGFSEISSTNIGDTVTVIEWGAYSSTNLSSLVLPDSVKYIENYTFNNQGLENVKMSDSILSIGLGAFSGTKITSVGLPGTIEGIGWYAFDTIYGVPEITCIGNEESCAGLENVLSEYKSYNGEFYLNPQSIKNYAGAKQCNSTNYYFNGNECLTRPNNGALDCVAGYRQNGKICNRMIYTIEEANAVAKPSGNTVRIKYR